MSSNDKFRAEFLFKLSMKNISITRNGLENFYRFALEFQISMSLKGKNTTEVIICLL